MEIRLRRDLRASPALYKAAVDDVSEALGHAVPVKDKPNAVHTHRDFCKGLVDGALHNKNVAAAARIERDRHDAAAAAGGGEGGGQRPRGRRGRGSLQNSIIWPRLNCRRTPRLNVLEWARPETLPGRPECPCRVLSFRA